MIFHLMNSPPCHGAAAKRLAKDSRGAATTLDDLGEAYGLTIAIRPA